MARKKRQRISYVLPLASRPGGHRLGVNGLAVDPDRSILYTGGRDGVICSWNLNCEAPAHTGKHDVADSSPSQEESSTFIRQVQAHTHWVNDIVLAQNNSALVSASSDVTVKVWRPHGNDPNNAQTIGVHTDYVKCVVSPHSNASWVASGGLDHKICLWDLNGAGKTLEINVTQAEDVTKGSIYALCAKPSILASGGPESVARLWDPKSGKSITKLVGHTDNIRSILMSDDGEILLTGSSDQTIKVWSITAGRCMHSLTMHSDSVWCMYSQHPQLSVFYSGDRSGLVAKTDVRHADEFDDGVSVAVCQDHEGVARIVPSGDYLWTASSSSSVNRWKDVDTEVDIETPPPTPKHERLLSSLSSSAQPGIEITAPETNGDATTERLPYTAVLRLSMTAPHPGRKGTQSSPPHTPPSIRKASEAIIEADQGYVIPVRREPAETIEGQNGLIKHVILNDRKRVLTLDTAGEVVLWDLLKCVPIRSYGRRHLDDVAPEVNTLDGVANWCAVDTRTGKLSIMLEEIYCFDAEVYLDEIESPEQLDFREDQRINLGKWVLRNLFTTLLEEEIKRDEIYRRTLRTGDKPAAGMQRNNVPPNISLPAPDIPDTLSPRISNGHWPMTPGMGIKVATPGAPPGLSAGHPTTTLTPTAEEESDPERQSQISQPPGTMNKSSDYFTNASDPQTEASADSNKAPVTPGEPQTSTVTNATSPNDDKEEKKKSTIFGKKFQMTFPKKLGRNSTEAKPITAAEDKIEDMSDKSSEKEEKVIEENFYGVIQRIRQDYADQLEANPDRTLETGITPSLPVETPILTPPPHTLIIIQEDNPESGGLVDLYRGEISQLGSEADILEKLAPTWLGELLLRNQIPYKDTVKVSFVLQPYQDLLPSIASPDGNARLNANRMLRSKKILAYVAERIEAPADPTQPNIGDDGVDTDKLRPDEYLELYCQDKKVDPNTTLATLRVHVWKTGGDVVLFYRSNGRKRLRFVGEEWRPGEAGGGGKKEGQEKEKVEVAREE